jgi:exodeoxyribonuclease-3
MELGSSVVPFRGTMKNMKIMCWNVNGLRAVEPKLRREFGSIVGFFSNYDPDILCIQETKISEEQKSLVTNWSEIPGYQSYWSYSSKKGYSGVVTFVKRGLTLACAEGFQTNSGVPHEGRIMMTDHGAFYLLNVYLPNVPSVDRLNFKIGYCKEFEKLIERLQLRQKNIIIVGDLNITHKPIDGFETLNPFTEPLRVWLSQFLQRKDFVDSVRYFHPNEPGLYTWFNPKKRALNKGWRVDYGLISKEFFLHHVQSSSILKNQFGSDHCPMLIQLQNVETLSVEQVNKPKIQATLSFGKEVLQRKHKLEESADEDRATKKGKMS